MDLYHEFKDIREIDEVFIPSKRTRWWKKYGFVRFFNVSDKKLLETKMGNIFLDGKKIFVNLPKFERKNITRKLKGPSISGKINHFLSGSMEGVKGGSNVVKGVSFAQMLKGETSMVVREYVSEEEDRRRLEKVFVREVVIPGTETFMQDQFHSEGFLGITVTPLRSSLCLLEESQEEGVLEELMEGNNKWLEGRI